MNEHLLVKKHDLEHDGMRMPKKHGDVGFDLATSEDFDIPPHNQASAAFIVPAGVSIKSPDGYFCIIVGRSSSARRGLSIQLAVIDNGYTGPMFACVYNLTDKVIKVQKGERLAQVVFLPICVPQIVVVDKLPETERGDTGFGSSGR